MACPCEDLEGEELVRCLAPPPGDYEVHIPVSRDKAVVVNNGGIGLRTIILDETLPFINTFTRPLPLDRALALTGLTIDQLLCRVLEALERAALAGSLTSRRRLAECSSMVARIAAQCRG